MLKPMYAYTRPIPELEKCYRNGPGQVRKVLDIAGGTLTYRVIIAGPGLSERQRNASHKPGDTRTVTLDSFRQWLTHECDVRGKIIEHNLSNPTPRTGRKLEDALKLFL